MAKSKAVINPNLGLYLDRSTLALPAGALQDGLNFRIQQGRLTNINLGWSSFAPFTLNGAVRMIATHHLRAGTDILIFATPTDLYKYSTGGGGSVTYITPRYATGTAAASGTGVTGTGTAWNTGSPKNAKAGDEISFGNAAQNSPSATWYTIQTVNTDTSITLTATAGVVVDGPYTIRKKFTGTTLGYPWVWDEFINAQPSSEDRIYMTNGVDPPIVWNGTDSTVTQLNSLGFTCRTLVVYKNMVIYGNLVQGGVIKPSDIINSDVASPEVIASGLAAQFKVSGTPDVITRMAKLGDYLVIYLQKSIILANFVGSPLIFVFRTITTNKGLQSTHGVAVYPGYHEFIGGDTMYAMDGSIAKPVSGHVWREIIRTQDPARAANVFVVQDEHRGDYIWSVPLTTDTGAGTATSANTVAYASHYLEIVPQGAEVPYSKRSFPFTSAGNFTQQSTITWDQLTSAWGTYNFAWNDQFFAAQFPQIIVGDANGKVWTLNASQNANAAALPSFVRFGRRAVVDGNNRGLVSRLIPFVTQFSNPINITASFADFANGNATINMTVSYDQSLPEGLYFAPIYRAGRYVEFEFGTSGVSQPWEVFGYDYMVKAGGNR